MSTDSSHADNLPVMQTSFRMPVFPMPVSLFCHSKKLNSVLSGDFYFFLLPFNHRQSSCSTHASATFHFDFVASCFCFATYMDIAFFQENHPRCVLRKLYASSGHTDTDGNETACRYIRTCTSECKEKTIRQRRRTHSSGMPSHVQTPSSSPRVLAWNALIR